MKNSIMFPFLMDKRTFKDEGGGSASDGGGPNSESGGNTVGQAWANSFTPDDGMQYRNGVLEDMEGNAITTNTAAQDMKNAFSDNDNMSYEDGQLVTDGGNSDNNNSFRMDMANAMTKGKNTTYKDNVLYDDKTGKAVTENTGYQDLTNLATIGRGGTYVDGQWTEDNEFDFSKLFQGDGSNAAGNAAAAAAAANGNNNDSNNDNDDNVVTSDQGGAAAAASSSVTAAATNEDVIKSLKDTLAELSGDGGETDLPEDEFITEEELSAYLADLDLGSNAYDPAAFMNAYGFSLEGNNQDNLIASNGSGDYSSGAYVRRAVKDRETGEIRYVNVPIGNGAVAGNSGSGQFRDQRRNGFGSMMV
tara:strand:+ start:1865 stop:2947 length:1083 start_codon:yes stop_codon:yes gene_type:complete